MNLNIDEIEERCRYEEERLTTWGWSRSERQLEDRNGKIYTEQVWVDPVQCEDYDAVQAYLRAIERMLKDSGWRNVKEVKRIGKLEWNRPLETWGRYQSPSTKRIYSFIEAMQIVEDGWDERIWPDGCSEHTRLLNGLVGENFSGDEVRTWFYHGENKERVFELW